MGDAQCRDRPDAIHAPKDRPVGARFDRLDGTLTPDAPSGHPGSWPLFASHVEVEDHKLTVERRVVAVYVNWGLDVCPYEVPVRLSSGIPKGETIAVPSGMLARLYVFACFRSSFEAAALEPRINPSRDLTPQANVRTHQCIDLCMIQFPPALAKSLKGASRRPRELEP